MLKKIFIVEIFHNLTLKGPDIFTVFSCRGRLKITNRHVTFKPVVI